LPPGPGVNGRWLARVGDATEAAPVAADAVSGDCDVAALYRVEGPRLLRFFRRRTGDREVAQDLMHESFSRMLGSGAGPGLVSPGAYLRRIGQNLLRDRAKFAMRRSAASHEPLDEAELAGTDQCRLLETRDLLDRLELAMLELPRETREIFMAHRLDGLTYGEIAERTGLTLKQVEKRLVRAMVEINRILGPL